MQRNNEIRLEVVFLREEKQGILHLYIMDTLLLSSPALISLN